MAVSTRHQHRAAVWPPSTQVVLLVVGGVLVTVLVVLALLSLAGWL